MAKSTLANSIKRELDELIGKLVEVGLADSQNFPSERKLADGRWAVSTDGPDLAMALKKRPYANVYASLRENNTYGALLLDGAMLQFSYEGAGEALIRHRLSYLPSPSLEPFQNDPELYFHELHFVDIVGYQVVPVPIRFDFDAREGVAVEVTHPVSHLTLGQYQHCRLPVVRPLAPTDFVSFIVRNFYSTPASKPVDFPSYVDGLIDSITDVERAHVHMMFPMLS
ncbi:DUF2290 domain-containing protein [Leucobacter sp. VD1]|uniref:DUF2290 domain-containing protein n=1 Tax=Leucobacter sp. VD1 TaxID=3080381 RepID=UPI003018A06C